MKSEHGYTALFIFTLCTTVAVFAQLLQKYSYGTAYHFLKTCSVTITTFFSSSYHFVGFAVLSAVCILGICFLGKVLFSLLKTQQKIRALTRLTIPQSSKIIQKVCQKNSIDSKAILLIQHPDLIAFTIGIFTQKIVISSGLVKKLSSVELEAVILHELHHLKNHHGLLLLTGEIITSTLTFLPFLQDVLAQMRRTFEYDADKFAANSQNTTQHVMTAIKKLTNISPQLQFVPAFAVTTIDQRLDILASDTDRVLQIHPIKLGSSILMSFLLCLLFSVPTTAQAAEVEVLSTNNCLPTLQCSIHCQDTGVNQENQSRSEIYSSSRPFSN